MVASAIGATRSAPCRKIFWMAPFSAVNLRILPLHRLQLGDDHVRHVLLHVAVAHAFEVAADLFLGPAAESLEDGEQILHACAQLRVVNSGLGIGHSPGNQLLDPRWRVKQADGVVRARRGLAHLLRWIVEAHHARAHRG